MSQRERYIQFYKSLGFCEIKHRSKRYTALYRPDGVNKNGQAVKASYMFIGKVSSIRWSRTKNVKDSMPVSPFIKTIIEKWEKEIPKEWCI